MSSSDSLPPPKSASDDEEETAESTVENSSSISTQADQSNTATTTAAKKKKKKKKKSPNSESAAFVAAQLDPRISAYDRMEITPIPMKLPADYYLSTDRISTKVNNNSSTSSSNSSSSAAVSSVNSSFQFRIYNSSSDSLGRRAIALSDLPAGSLMVCERPMPAIIHQEHKYRVCHLCVKTIFPPINPIQLKKGGLGSIVIGCAKCERVFYCSPECKAQHAAIHDVECTVLQQLDRISDEALVNVDLLRSALAYLINRKGRKIPDTNTIDNTTAAAAVNELDSKVDSLSLSSSSSSSSASSSSPSDFHPDWLDCENMISHEELMNSTDRLNCMKSAKILLSLLPIEYTQNIEYNEIVKFMARVNSNSHALAMEEINNSNIHYGFGLFPLCSIFNHSCYPNCIFINSGDNLMIKTIRNIKKNDELCVNYIGLYSSLPGRRYELWNSKRFHCNCRRCILKPANEEEKSKFFNDQFLGGVLCTKKDSNTGMKICSPNAVYRIIKPIVIEMKSNNNNNNNNTGNTNEIELPKPILRCSECGSTADLPQLSKLEQEIRQKSDSLLELYSSNTITPISMKSQLIEFHSYYSSLIHSNHEVFFNILLPLINCYSVLKEFKLKYEYIKLTIRMSELIFPDSFLPLANYYDCLIDTLMNLMNNNGNTSNQNHQNNNSIQTKQLPKKIWLKYKEERQLALEKLISIHRICHGENHSLTKGAIKMMNEGKLMKQPIKD